MLSSLRIRNFALIDDVELTFDKGMSVLTGETGAGKSVIVTALGLVLGERADREHIRHGATKALVEATFDVRGMSRHYKKEFADYIADGSFTVSREIARDGSSRAKINGAAATVARLRELTSPLAEIIGQHASRLLLSEDNHLLFLDQFASVDKLREETAQLFARWERVANELNKIRNRREELTKERELLLFQRREIEDACVRIGEEEDLHKEKRILDSSRTLMESADTIQAILDSEDNSLLDGIRRARKELDRMSAIDPSLKSKVTQMTELDYQLEEMRRFIEQYGSSVPDDPGRLEEINQRLDELYQLKQKYGGSEKAILDTLDSIRKKLQDRPDTDSLIETLEEKNRQCRTEYTEKALTLSEIRNKAATYLQKLVIKELAELAIEQAAFEFEFVYEDDPEGIELGDRRVRAHAHGLENGRFLFSANPGEPLKSLVRTASGGEISRVLLALKAAQKKNNNLMQSLLVFDESDTGIGGRTAKEVARKLRKLSESCQVLVITHLHQIAREAGHHYLAAKTRQRGPRAIINVAKLEGKAITAEIDRMVALPQTEKNRLHPIDRQGS